MKANWTIIPQINRIDESMSLASEYGAAFEYNDFFEPKVYEDVEEVKRRIEIYRSLKRDRKNDTLHGAFYDMVANSKDSIIRKHSRELMEYSMSVAEELECKGVVFHTGLIAGLNTDAYIDDWTSQYGEFMQELAERHPNTMIYVENTFERTPAPFVDLNKKLEELSKNLFENDNIKLCLDYAHAILTPTPVEEWADAFAGKLGHIHINDNDLQSDLHLPPGSGIIDYDRFHEVMRPFLESENINILIEVNGIENQRSALEFLTAK